MTPILDRKKHQDPASRGFGISEKVTGVARSRKIWGYPKFRNDQGQEGHCVGFGWTNELNGDPLQFNYDNQFAHDVFYGAQKIDREVHNLHFDGGATVLAGAKEIKRRGFMGEYRWAFGIEQTLDALIGHGPVVLGIDWYDGMYETRPSGLVEVTGNIVGGHCITAFGYHPGIRLLREGFKSYEVVPWVNSWGKSYGRNGIGYIKVEDLARLLANQGDACVPMHRSRPPKVVV